MDVSVFGDKPSSAAISFTAIPCAVFLPPGVRVWLAGPGDQMPVNGNIRRQITAASGNRMHRSMSSSGLQRLERKPRAPALSAAQPAPDCRERRA